MTRSPAAPEPEPPPPTCGEVLKERGLWLLVLLGAVYFYRPLLLGETFFFRDLQLIFLPAKQIWSELLRSGEPPFWNPYLHGGVPLLADIQNSSFYPSSLLYLFLSPPAALSLELVLHCLAAAASAYLLARCLGLSPAAAFMAGGVYAFCGYTLSKFNIFFHLLATPYVPLMLLFWHLHLREGRWRWFVLTLVGGALQVLTGAPEIVVLTLLTLLGWGFFVTGARLTWPRSVARWCLLGAGIAGLASIQLVPMLELVLQSARGEGLDPQVVSKWSVHPARLPELLVPGFLGRADTVGAGDFWGRALTDGELPFMLSLYLGAVPLALALLAGAHRGAGVPERRLRVYLLLLLGLALVFSLGRFLPLYDVMYRWNPAIRFFRYPVKILSLGILPVSLLAGSGVDLLFAAGGRSKAVLKVAWAVGLGLVSLLLLWLAIPGFRTGSQVFFFGNSAPKIEQGLRSGLLQIAGVWLLAALIYQAHRLRPRAWLAWALAGVVLLDLMKAGQPLNPTTSPKLISAAPQAAVLARENLAGGRFYRSPLPHRNMAFYAPSSDAIWLSRWNLEILVSSMAIRWSIPVIYHGDIESLAPRRLMKIKGAAESRAWPQRLPLLSAAAVRVFMTEEELDLPGVERLAAVESGGGTRSFIYRNPRAAERAEFVTVYHRAGSADEAMGAMLGPGFDPRQHAVVEGEVPEAAVGCAAKERIEVREAKLLRRRLSVTSDCPGLLVLSELYYPGWEARVDGRPATLLRANVAFSAVWLPPGEHEVEWRFVPRIFQLGLAVSTMTLALLAILSWRRIRGARRRS